MITVKQNVMTHETKLTKYNITETLLSRSMFSCWVDIDEGIVSSPIAFRFIDKEEAARLRNRDFDDESS